MSAELHIWTVTTKTDRFFGAAHAGLAFKYYYKNYYVTWFGSGSSKSSAVNGHVNLGFNQIEKNGQIWERTKSPDGIDTFHLPGTDTKLTKKVPAPFDPNIMLTEAFTSTTVYFELEQDYYKAQGRPHYSIPIPAQNFFDSGKALTQGIDLHSISKWWEAKMALPPNSPGREYRLISKSKNCISTVIEGLIVGGMGMYKKPSRALLYYSENDLQTWVTEAVERMNRFNQLMSTSVAVQEIKNQSGTSGFHDIPTLRAWKTESNQNVKFSVFAKRKAQIKKLDKLIELYHSSNLEKIQKRELLIRIMNQAFAHMVTKPNSDRRLAVKNLAQIAYDKAKQLTEEIDKEELAQRLAGAAQNVLVRKSLDAIFEEDDMSVEFSEDEN